MNYKLIIPNRRIRLYLLKLCDFIPDIVMIHIQFYLSKGYVLNVKNPKRFTEKLQWYKLYYRKNLMTLCSDKYRVRTYIKAKGLSDILVPLYGVFQNVEDINFAALPQSFVLKTNNGSHTNILCKEKENLDIYTTKLILKRWLRDWQCKVGREWSYYNIEPLIICEEYLPTDNRGDLIDYKFFCFNGVVFCLYVIVDRFLDSGIKLGIYDKNFTKLPFNRSDIPDVDRTLDAPKNFENMIKIAEKLSADFPHARVDLYNIEGRIFFGELTFYDGSGYKGYLPDSFDNILGEKFELPSEL